MCTVRPALRLGSTKYGLARRGSFDPRNAEFATLDTYIPSAFSRFASSA